MRVNYATNIALVNIKSHKVDNIIWGLIYQLDEFASNDILPVPFGDLNVAIGDSYDGEKFTHTDGNVAYNIEDELNAYRTIDVSEIPARKDGYRCVPRYNPKGGSIVWEFIKDENSPVEDGTYIHPFAYSVGDSVTTNLWYADESGNVWMAIKNGTPVDFSDKEYFDIIEL